ncbi:hypothetical protein CBER1_05040 [Cercospora berteroae]|uniref:Uncharacterized protein n=1 Tax=Cercospora berteroae TaxID=357750 RepID=A0A2S6BRI4_9PEZI|nr:hypothetical protein CBER1_05040 [Cercospora berteroae]
MEAPNEPGVEMSPKTPPKSLHSSAPASPQASNLVGVIADQIGRPELSEDWNSPAINTAAEMVAATGRDMPSISYPVSATGSQQTMPPASTQTDTAASFIDPSLPTISKTPPIFVENPAIPKTQPNKRSAQFLEEDDPHLQPNSDRPSPKRRCLKATATRRIQQDGDGAPTSSVERSLPPPGYFAFSGRLQSLNPYAAVFETYQTSRSVYQDAATSAQTSQKANHPSAPYYVWEPIGGDMGAEPDPSVHGEASPLDTNQLTHINNEQADPFNANLYQQLNAFNAGTVPANVSPFRGDFNPRLGSTNDLQPAGRRIKTSEVPSNARPPMGVDITLKEICVFAPTWIIHPAVATRLQRNGVKIAEVAAAQVEAIGRAGEPALLKTVKNRLKRSTTKAVALDVDDNQTADQWKFRDFYKHRNKETKKAPTEDWEDIPLITFYENIPQGKWPTGQDRGILTRMLEQVQEDGLTDFTTAHWNLVAAMLENEPPLQSEIAGKNLDGRQFRRLTRRSD